jgi:hypothetical protein
MQEHRQWAREYKGAWDALDKRHSISSVRSLDAILADAAKRTDYPGGAQRAVREVKGDLVTLWLYDRLLAERDANSRVAPTAEPRVIFDGVAEELLPVLPRIAPRNAELLNFIDYTPTRVLKRRDSIGRVPAREIPCTMIFTLHDDNVGLLPQLATRSLDDLMREIRKHGWAGFSTRYWLLGDQDTAVAYLAHAAWDERVTPALIESGYVHAVFGADAAGSMLRVFAEVEAATRLLEEHGLGFAFPTPAMMTQHWDAAAPLPPAFAQVEQHYMNALNAAREALAHSRDGAGKSIATYWVGRLEFGIGYLHAVSAARQAGRDEREGRRADALKSAEASLQYARGALEAYAGVVRDRSDRGAIAVMDEYVYRSLKAKVEHLRH